MKFALDVAQTCAERAGCAWWAEGCAHAIAAARPDDSVELYHHFGSWINGSTAGGTMVQRPNVSAPLFTVSADAARAFWAEREAGVPLPGKPEIVLSQSFHAPRTPGSALIYTVFDLVFLTRPEFSTTATRLLCQRELLQALARAAGFVFISDFTRLEFESVFPGWLEQTGRPWTRAWPGCRFPRASEPVAFTPGAPWLFVGSLEPRKNVGTLLDAYVRYTARSASPRPLHLIGGRGWMSEETHLRIADLATRLPVRHLGYLGEGELMQALRSAQALIFPSWHEGFGMPVLEAMNSGLPVITSSRGALPEVTGGHALVIDPSSAASIAEAMLRLDSDPEAHRSLGQAGLAHAASFGWDHTANAILELASRVEFPVA